MFMVERSASLIVSFVIYEMFCDVDDYWKPHIYGLSIWKRLFVIFYYRYYVTYMLWRHTVTLYDIENMFFEKFGYTFLLVGKLGNTFILPKMLP